ncbi:hypothetical protein C1645_817290 [Glomus cerebriforme]|uniref:Uncharacterized protein n=1 Tax=Glomus cerebriforme TaxID=658196 RepID=A0A397TEM5_9GLOM|nr:hypothetical protein C1645_817290 [Glomus cerebriforme]
MILILAAISLASSGDFSFDFNLFLDCSISEGLVIDQGIRICQYHLSSPWRALFSSYSNNDEVVVILGRGGVDDVVVILGRSGVDEVVVRGVNDVVVILGQGGINEVVVILGQGGVDKFLSVEDVEDVGEGGLLRSMLGLDEDWDDIDENVNKDRLFCGVLGWDDIDESGLFCSDWDDKDFL